jgi:LmbE family N-acetylglucosaminyl deacetylase
MTLRPIIALLISFLALEADAQTFRPPQPPAGSVISALDKLPVFGNVLYLAAHPDDENTRFIAWCANQMHLNTSYLSITRGDGGQNLIGPELREELGLIRTQELLAARRTDGGMQFFTRANDFGYSKTTEETVRIWKKNQVLEDMVRVIRLTRPDVIVCRFPPDSRAGHGHHSASAVLGKEAFHLASDPAAFPQQLTELQPWAPKRIVINTGRWWNEEISEKDPGVVMADIGQYNPLIGLSYNELAAHSRSLHKSQGFGSTGTRGEMKEYFEYYDGQAARTSLWDGIDLTSARAGTSKAFDKQAADIRRNFRPESPWLSLPALAALHRTAQNGIADSFWKQIKLREIEDIMLACTGLYFQARADRFESPSGERIKISFECINRSPARARLVGISSSELGADYRANLPLANNQLFEKDTMLTLPAELPISHPPHLRLRPEAGMFRSDRPERAIYPESPSAVSFVWEWDIEGISIRRSEGLTYRWNDPVDGERHRPFVIVPPVTATFDAEARILKSGSDSEIQLTLTAHRPDSGRLYLIVPEGYRAFLREEKPGQGLNELRKVKSRADAGTFVFSAKGQTETLQLVLRPDANAEIGELMAEFYGSTGISNRSMRVIAHNHIPHLTWFQEASVRLAPIELNIRGFEVGYLPGAGDEIPTGLREMGYKVTELSEKDILSGNLSRFTAIILGVRAINTIDNIGRLMPRLHAYAEAGGNVIVQYNTNRSLKMEEFAPKPLQLGRDRVTEEDAPVTFLLPDDPVLNQPNHLTQIDFEGWVQERGLYFGSRWHEDYRAPLGWSDTGEDTKTGALLILRHGKGHFVYTGISFFRQLPAGVTGAYRLLANIIALQ